MKAPDHGGNYEATHQDVQLALKNLEVKTFGAYYICLRPFFLAFANHLMSPLHKAKPLLHVNFGYYYFYLSNRCTTRAPSHVINIDHWPSN
ncbi:hypothetical protein V6N13_114772 [Hibiscus sabdariffa]